MHAGNIVFGIKLRLLLSVLFGFVHHLMAQADLLCVVHFCASVMQHSAKCSHCGKDAHITCTEFNEIRSQRGEQWLMHYVMLRSAQAGCVQTLKAYVEQGGSIVNGRALSVWDGSANKQSFNAYRATFECQNEQTILDQEACRQYLLSLDGAQSHIQTLASHSKSLAGREQVRDQLLSNKKRTQSGPHAVADLHRHCYAGNTPQVETLMKGDHSLLFATSFSELAQLNLRASDYCRMGKFEGNPVHTLLQWLIWQEASAAEWLSSIPLDILQDEEMSLHAVAEVHRLCYAGNTSQVQALMKADHALLFATSFSESAQWNLRATDYCRMGMYNDNPADELYLWLMWQEEVVFQQASIAALRLYHQIQDSQPCVISSAEEKRRQKQVVYSCSW